jgi:hypothetical protein
MSGRTRQRNSIGHDKHVSGVLASCMYQLLQPYNIILTLAAAVGLLLGLLREIAGI